MFWRSGPSGELAYESAGPLLSPAELSFYQVTSAAVGQSAMLLCKVRMVNVIKPRSGLSDSRWSKLFEPVSQKHLDFVLIDSTSLEPLCVLEFEDSSQLNGERQKRHQFIQDVCDAAAIPRVLIDARGGFSIRDIRQQLAFLWPDSDQVVSVQDEADEEPQVAESHNEPVGTDSESDQKDEAESERVESESAEPERSEPENSESEAVLNNTDQWRVGGGFSESAENDASVPLAVSLDINEAPAPSEPLQSLPEQKIEPALPVVKQETALTPDPVEPSVKVSTPRPKEALRESKPLRATESPAKEARSTGQSVAVKAPDCPKCGSPLVRRQPKTGKLAGQFIWACSTYPTCRYLAPLKAHKMIKARSALSSSQDA